jgi:divalent metal cation (Fe/Co/Zn/Cd) transporter
MSVRSVEMKNGRATRWTRPDWPVLLALGGVWLAITAFGGVFWAINGGFSVLGLEVVATSFNTAGRLCWAALASITFPVPVHVPGLPQTQPLLPWLGVLAASLLQVCVLYLKLRGRDVPLWMLVAAVLLSLYDLGTTFFGLGTVAWIARAGYILQGLLAVILTFIFEVTVSFMLRR